MTRHGTLHVAIALFFALHTSGLCEGAVLCVSSDGHVSLEAKGAPCCGPKAGEGAATSPAAVGHTASLAGCGDCTDIPLASIERSASTPAETKSFAPGGPGFLPGTPAIGAAAVKCCGQRLAPNEPACGRGAWSHIRSVILRR